jgi:hypothetical protein
MNIGIYETLHSRPENPTSSTGIYEALILILILILLGATSYDIFAQRIGEEQTRI